MDYGIFRKQVYRGTGSQRDSRPEITDSIQRRIAAQAVSVTKMPIHMLLFANSNHFRPAPLESAGNIIVAKLPESDYLAGSEIWT